MDYNIDFISSEESTELGKRVKALYNSEEEIGNPEDVNTLVALFPGSLFAPANPQGGA